jgi:hypothetical protein
VGAWSWLGAHRAAPLVSREPLSSIPLPAAAPDRLSHTLHRAIQGRGRKDAQVFQPVAEEGQGDPLAVWRALLDRLAALGFTITWPADPTVARHYVVLATKPARAGPPAGAP